MADPFATALGTLFAGPRAVAAVYRAFGTLEDIPLRVVRYQATEDLQLGEMIVPVGTTIVEIDRGVIAEPDAGDVLTIGDEVLEIVGEPRLDKQALKWLCEAPPRPYAAA